MAKENGKMTIVYSEPRSDKERASGPPEKRNVFNKHTARCPFCGKESPVDPKRIGRGWERLQPADPAIEANPPTEEELQAGKDYHDRYEEYRQALGNLGELKRKVDKNVFMNADGGRAYKNKGLGEEQDALIGEAERQLEDARERLGQAQFRYNKLVQIRNAATDALRKEEQLKAQRAREAARVRRGAGSYRWIDRLKEVLSD